MAASQSAVAPSTVQVPVRRFECSQAAIMAMAGYEAALREAALRRRSNSLTVADQDHPDEAFYLCPARTLSPPLAIIGGMGPLAGAMAFRRACARFGNSRAVVLYQACSMPDRSTIILSEGDQSYREMAWLLSSAVRQAVALLSPAGQITRCIVACNSAHYFWPRLEHELGAYEVQMISLVDATLQTLKIHRSRKTLVLVAEGARVGQVFSAPLREAGIAFDEPSPTLGNLLMRAIFEGVKAIDDGRTVELGNEFFESILATGRDYDCVLAGCTEIPLIIDLLRLRGSPAVAARLSRVRIVDPLEEALCHA
jgi:aspartate racemase